MITVLTGVALGGGILLLLPQAVRRLVLSVVIIFHFLGIATAITSVPPTPWFAPKVRSGSRWSGGAPKAPC